MVTKVVLEIAVGYEFAFVIVCLCGYVGWAFAFGVVGPVIAFICGGFLLQIYTDFDTVDTSTSVYYTVFYVRYIVLTVWLKVCHLDLQNKIFWVAAWCSG